MKTTIRFKTTFILGWLLVPTLILGGMDHAFAQGKLNELEIRTAVETWVRTFTPDARPAAVIETFEPYEKDGEVRAYIARLQGGGFCLCGSDALVLPVYLYSPKGTYDPRSPNCIFVLEEIAAGE